MKNDLTVAVSDKAVLNIRVGAIIMKQDKFLMVGNDRAEYLYSVGGRIQLCDSIATAEGIVSIEERMQDVKKRYGCYPQEKWERNMELKEYFESKAGMSLEQIFK